MMTIYVEYTKPQGKGHRKTVGAYYPATSKLEVTPTHVAITQPYTFGNKSYNIPRSIIKSVRSI